MCLRTDLDLTYDTPVAVIDTVRDAIEAALRAHPRLWQESVRVHVVAFTESAIRLHVLAWFETTDWPEFLMIRHRMLLRIREIVTEQGSQVAFPSRTVYHVTGGSSEGAATAPMMGPTTGPDTGPQGAVPLTDA
jgi:MscS family membrane protein